MAEEMTSSGEGQIKALVTIAGNPVISSANANELDEAIAGLDFYVAFDFYINATTRHADVILPPTSPLEHDHYDIAFHHLAVRNTARYNPVVFDAPENSLHDWQIFNAITKKVHELKGKAYRPLPAPDKIVEAGIEADMYSADHNSDIALTMDKLKASPHGIDLGPLEPGIPERISTESGCINAAPELYINDIQRLLATKTNRSNDQLLLIGRRHVRSNNSWMHNYHRLVKGPSRWQLMMHPDDLASRNIEDGADVIVQSRVGELTTTVQATDEVMPGVVSLPHGWGHQRPGVKLEIASQQQGKNCNVLTDDKFIDAISGNAALNGVPVSVVADIST